MVVLDDGRPPQSISFDETSRIKLERARWSFETVFCCKTKAARLRLLRDAHHAAPVAPAVKKSCVLQDNHAAKQATNKESK